MKLITRIINAVSGLSQKTGEAAMGDKTLDANLVSSARQLASEGVVLLKNDGTLPFSASDEVAVFGRVQNDYFYVGYGSGGDVKAPYKVSLMQGIANSGAIRVNEPLAKVYADWCASHVPDEGFWGHWPLNFAEMPLDASLVEQSVQTSTVALVVIGRAAGEDREQKLVKGGYYLTDAERDMLNKVTAAFKRTVVLIDAGNVMDLAWIEGYGDKISALMYAWQGGMESGNAVADVLSGAVDASGRLSDTIAKDYADYPSSANFGAVAFNNYAEDIYVGYRYFETFARDKVLFPFGYGLSYTSFNRTYTLGFDGKTASVVGTSVNVGKRAGKDVVQIYVEPPQGKLGKPLRNLIAFAKTQTIPAGESEQLTMHFTLDDVASFDDGDVLGYGAAYVAEVGTYNVYVGASVRDASLVGSFNLTNPYVKKVSHLCVVESGKGFDVLYPKQNPKQQCSLSQEQTFSKAYRPVAINPSGLKARVERNMPKTIAPSAEHVDFASVKSGKRTLSEFVATLSVDEMEVLSRGDLKMNSSYGTSGNAGAFGGICESLRAKGVPSVTVTDGPSGIRLMKFASLLPCGTAIASSWNSALTEVVYAHLGDEMKRLGSDCLLGAGMNLHRDPLCGRNFEYYSEDPLLSGRTAAAMVKGVQSKGVSACPKHFACNNQETARNHTDSRVSERALRELYLRGFELCVKEASPHLMMTSYNRINGVFSCYNYDLCTAILRDEWGYKGAVVTDWWTIPESSPDFENLSDSAYRIRAQVDVVMPGGSRLLGRYKPSASNSYSKGALTLGELQRGATNVLGFILSTPSTAAKIK